MARKLYIKQKVLTMPGRDNFSVKDEGSNDVYYIKGKVFSLHNSIEVFDLQDNVVAKVAKKHLTLRPTFEIDVHGKKYATISKDLMSIGRDKYSIELEHGSMSVSGSLFDHNFKIKRDGTAIGHVSKARISWGDSYEITLEEQDQNLELLAVAIVLTIDTIDAEHKD